MSEYNNKCQFCGKKFKTNRKNQKYCSSNHEFHCSICGKESYGNPSYLKDKLFPTCGDSSCVKEAAKRTNLIKYGVENPSQSQKVKEKKKITTLKNFGVENPMHSDKVKSKLEKTIKKKYGVKNISQSKEIKNKKTETLMENYGVENPLQSDEIKEKQRNTVYEKYGVFNVSQSEKIKRKKEETTISNYGVKNPFESTEIKQKIKEQNLNNLGIEHHMQLNIKNYENWININDFLVNNKDKYNVVELMDYFNVCYSHLHHIILDNNLQPYIRDYYKSSLPEQKLERKLMELGLERDSYIKNIRTVIAPYELDIYFPNKKIAIEISPYFHHKYNDGSFVFGKEDANYHQNKFLMCQDKGIELFTVFDWHDINKITEMVYHRLVGAEKRVYARKTVSNICFGKNKSLIDFIDKYHILSSPAQRGIVGYSYLTISGSNDILGVAMFTQKNRILELKRLVFRPGYNVVGGSSKLVKSFLRAYTDFDEFITFSDCDFGSGNVYSKIGFELIEQSQPQLNWYNPKVQNPGNKDIEGWLVRNLSLVSQGTDRLLKRFPGYKHVGQGENLPSNQDIIKKYGFYPIYDCGYKKWKWSGGKNSLILR